MLADGVDPAGQRPDHTRSRSHERAPASNAALGSAIPRARAEERTALETRAFEERGPVDVPAGSPQRLETRGESFR